MHVETSRIVNETEILGAEEICPGKHNESMMKPGFTVQSNTNVCVLTVPEGLELWSGRDSSGEGARSRVRGGNGSGDWGDSKNLRVFL